MDGAAIEYTIYTVFAANAFGVHFSLFQFIFLVVLCIVCSAGAAGVPGGGIVMCSICIATMGMQEVINKGKPEDMAKVADRKSVV